MTSVATTAGERPDVAPAQPIHPLRTLFALPEAVGGRVAAVERPAIRIGAALLAGSVIILALLANAVPWLAWLGTLPWWLPPILITGAAAVIVAAMPLALLPRRSLDAWVAATFESINSRAGWSSVTGDAYPEGPGAVEAWQAAHADVPKIRRERAGVLLELGRPGDALELLEGEPPTEHDAAFLHAQLVWLAGHMLGRDHADLLERCRELAAGYPAGSDHRRVADASVDYLDAMRALALEADWTEPLVRARRSLGRLARGIAFRELFLPRLVYYGRYSAIVAAALIGLQLAVDALSA